MRPIALLPLAALIAFLGGCNSSDAGSTMTVSLGDIGVILAAESPSTEATTPTIYEGKSSAAAMVSYRGSKKLAYQWSVQFPGEVYGEAKATDASLEITPKVLAMPGNTPNIGSGVGTISLTVYEVNGTISGSAKAAIHFGYSSGG